MSVRRYVQQGMAMIGAVGHQRKGAGAFTLKEQRARKAKHRYEAQIAALQAEREEMRAALWAAGNQERTVGVSDYEWHVELAAKGLAQRDKYPMPPSVTTAEDSTRSWPAPPLTRRAFEIFSSASLGQSGTSKSSTMP